MGPRWRWGGYGTAGQPAYRGLQDICRFLRGRLGRVLGNTTTLRILRNKKMNRSLILVTAAAALVLTACTSTPSADNTTSTSPSPEPTMSVVTEVVTNTVTNPPKPDDRPGYGALKLGMTLEQAQATGMAGTDFHVTVEGKCRYNSNVTITDEGGVERIVLPKDAKTSAGVGVGTTLADVKKAYPSAVEESLGYFADVPGDARILFETSDTFVPRKLTDKVATIKLFKLALRCSAAVF
jgi:hypothetical protein